MTQRQPTLLSSCALATTAAEARFRIDAPAFAHRSSRVIALDADAAAAVRDMADGPWGGGHFLVFESALPDDALLRRAPGNPDDATPGNPDESNGTAATALLSEELDGADTVVMVASAQGSSASATAASIIGDAAAARAIMSAGLVIPGDASGDDTPDEVVAALRPNAMVLVILRNPTDLREVLSALRV